MKTLKRAFIAIFAMSIVFTAQATSTDAEVEPGGVTFRQTSEYMTFDILMNTLDSESNIKLVDQAQNILWEDVAELSDGQYGKRINVKNLVNGDYNLVITDAEKELIQPITVSNKGVEVKEDQCFTVYFPEINVKSKSLSLKMRQNRSTVARISFADADGNIFFTDKSNDTSIRKKYDTSSLEEGTYVVYVSTPYSSYSSTFEVK